MIFKFANKGSIKIMKSFFLLIGRILLSVIFFASAVLKVFDWNNTVQFTRAAFSRWEAGVSSPDIMHEIITLMGVYLVPLLVIATLLEGIGGIFVLLGFKVRLGASMLIIFLVGATILMHPFWFHTGNEKTLQMSEFIKNLAILGGLLILAVKGEERSAE
jgi:putative oxidoreductase